LDQPRRRETAETRIREPAKGYASWVITRLLLFFQSLLRLRRMRARRMPVEWVWNHSSEWASEEDDLLIIFSLSGIEREKSYAT
jgi:hypothetical protein